VLGCLKAIPVGRGSTGCRSVWAGLLSYTAGGRPGPWWPGLGGRGTGLAWIPDWAATGFDVLVFIFLVWSAWHPGWAACYPKAWVTAQPEDVRPAPGTGFWPLGVGERTLIAHALAA